MKRFVWALALVVLCAVPGYAEYLGVVTTSDVLVMPLLSLDADGYAVDADSAQITVWHQGVGDNTYTYNDAPGDLTGTWMAAVDNFAGSGVEMYYLRATVGDIDGAGTDGVYGGVVSLWESGERCDTRFSFYLSAGNTNTVYDRIDENVSTGTVDVVSISGSSDAADTLELRQLRHDADKITDKLAAMGLADSAHVGVEAAAINLDNATGTLANSQIDDDVDINVKSISSSSTAADNLEESFDNDATGGDLDLTSLTITTGGLSITNTSGNGITVSATDGDGVNIIAAGNGYEGIYVQADGTASQAIELSADGASGIGFLVQGNASDISGNITGDITGSLSGSVGSVTDSVIVDVSSAHAADGLAAAIADSVGQASVPDSVAAIARLVNSYATDSALLVQTYFRTDSIADTVIAHAPHGDNWASTGEASVPDSVAAVARLVNSYATDSTNWVTIKAKTDSLDFVANGDSAFVMCDVRALTGRMKRADTMSAFFDTDTGANLSNSEILIVNQVEQVTVGAIAAISFANNAITQAVLHSSAATKIADSTWNRATDAMTWAPGSYANLLDNDSTVLAAVKAKTDNLPADPADDSDIDGQLAAIQTGIDSSAAHVSRPGNAYGNDSTALAAVKAKTDNLPADPADDSDIDGQLANIQAEVDNLDGADGSAWVTATGFSTHSAADVWTATGGDSVLAALADAGKLGIAAAGADTLRAHAPHGDNFATSGSASVPDSVAAVARIVNSYATDSALWVQTYQRIDSLADTVITHAPHADNWGGTGSAGTGSQTLAMFVIDTSGTDAVVANVIVTVYSSDQSSTICQGTSNSDGVILAGTDTLNSTASTSYVAKAFLPGYTFPVHGFTTGSASRFQDTMFCWDNPVSAAASASFKRVYVDVGYLMGDTTKAQGSVIQVEFIPPNNDTVPYDSSTSELIGVGEFAMAVVVNGKVNGKGSQVGSIQRGVAEVRRTDMMVPAGCKYKFTVLDRHGKVMLTKTCAVTGATAANLLDL